MSNPPVFRGRAFTALMMLGGFLALAVSGIVLFISPSGRVARELDWQILSLDKWQWRDFHIAFAAAFIIAAIVHITLNIKPLLHYLRQKVMTQTIARNTFRTEPFVAIILCLILGASAVRGWPPISMVTDLRDLMMDSWEKPSHQ